MSSRKIKGLREFHESYFEHNCEITEGLDDVLITDIPGDFIKARIKRWWHDLFLVSYSDKRCRTYYTSTEDIRLNRIRHFRCFKGRIHPLSKFRNFWDFMMLLLFIVNKILLHHNTSIVHGHISQLCYIAGPLIEIFIVADLFINIQTGYTDTKARRIILGQYEGCIHYCSRKLCFHVASAIPLQWILILRYGREVVCDLCKANLFILTIRLFGMFGLLRIYEYSSYWTRDRDSFILTSLLRFLRIFLVSLLTMVYLQAISDKILLMIMIREGRILETSYIGAMISAKFVDPIQYAGYTVYIFVFVRATKSMIRLNFTDANNYYLDKAVLILMNVIAHSFYLWSVVELYAFIYVIYSCENKESKHKSMAFNFACTWNLPDETIKRIWKYQKCNHAHMRTIRKHNALYNTLPRTLKNNIFLSIYNHYLKRIPLFSEWPPNVVEEICMLLHEEIYLSNDLIAEPWEQSDGLTIVATGEAAVYSGEEERGHLIDGDFFGELSLVTDNELRASRVVAVTSCVILLLEKNLFRKFMRDHQELFLALKQQLKVKFEHN